MKKYDLVIARYNEDLNWINQLNLDNINLCIYNKGINNIDFSYRSLKNIGGDTHTIITHIVENYNNLPEYLIFVQGNPFNRCKNIINLINSHVDNKFVYLTDYIVTTETLSGWYEDIIMRERNKPWFEENKNAFKQCFSLKQLVNIILPNEVPFNLEFAAGQQFITNKQYILNRSLDFYSTLLNRFNYDYILPWNIERLWKYILKV
jgi:hypothetical protein